MDSFELSRPAVVASVVDGEVVAINLDTGSYYNVAGSGTDIWTAVEGTASAEEIAARLAYRYDASVDEVTVAVTRFMDELLAEGLIRPAEATGQHAARPADDPPSATRDVFSPPVLEKFTDMEDLLLVDPVHDVSERGWPHMESD